MIPGRSRRPKRPDGIPSPGSRRHLARPCQLLILQQKIHAPALHYHGTATYAPTTATSGISAKTTENSALIPPPPAAQTPGSWRSRRTTLSWFSTSRCSSAGADEAPKGSPVQMTNPDRRRDPMTKAVRSPARAVPRHDRHARTRGTATATNRFHTEFGGSAVQGYEATHCPNLAAAACPPIPLR
jgi:hypothetical protein